MAKQSGLGDQLFIDGYNVSGDVGSIDTISTPMEPFEVTGINKGAKERIGGKRDAQMSFMSFFNPAANQSFQRLKLLPTTDVIATYFHGSTIGNVAFGMQGKQVNYDGSRGDDGSLTFKTDVTGTPNGGNWGEMLTPGIATIGAAGAQSSLDYGVSVGTTNFGLQAFLQVFALTGTSATVAIQSSTDNGAGDAFSNVTGAVFTAATGVTSERIITGSTQAVERYLRVNVTGTFTLLWFSVMVCRNTVATSF
jgi:hypothetical protein